MQLDALHMRGEVALIFRENMRVAASSRSGSGCVLLLWNIGSGTYKGHGRLIQETPRPTLTLFYSTRELYGPTVSPALQTDLDISASSCRGHCPISLHPIHLVTGSRASLGMPLVGLGAAVPRLPTPLEPIIPPQVDHLVNYYQSSMANRVGPDVQQQHIGDTSLRDPTQWVWLPTPRNKIRASRRELGVTRRGTSTNRFVQQKPRCTEYELALLETRILSAYAECLTVPSLGPPGNLTQHFDRKSNVVVPLRLILIGHKCPSAAMPSSFHAKQRPLHHPAGMNAPALVLSDITSPTSWRLRAIAMRAGSDRSGVMVTLSLSNYVVSLDLDRADPIISDCARLENQ
ncbi:hypothetical protein B0J13DRAFT_519392 [Dactylonectria estremocensis]|uniref:Uncharacterized protein n=1 Tax=Dactylonectria estremocensis TaxID=1079267 RepID=A0A9P9FBM4_9HYPO|nr:hypothetical protein B0J13DRAFT_519392 [Dactylonectria estremocensis]